MKRRFFTTKFLAAGLVTTSMVLTSCASNLKPQAQTVSSTSTHSATHKLTVFRTPTCVCCGQWIDRMEAAGFQIKDEITENVEAIKQQYGVPAEMYSCHTTIAAGYVIEGHIPAEDVQRLLDEKPGIKGIVVPGMPIGSPGMESGNRVEPYTVFTLLEDGTTGIFAEHS
ncbi:protein of unknown function DUF411 [Thalassoporum mexicanum PCC 7367]|uniref:DUF411 domain-containing protein n=1 Tax=Thalassoporum mexicanum TaxID=3457544 RepID=UPI00029FFF9F|nr:DUF411 domain-containing protein [Pseudanabaena sp. PCC 7367]AFY70012.1 protein of unknown function DUF411 [Pseudanabaena sp. PCC 7367]